ncbi:collagen alpha-1(I) chain-like [Neovison vison]|uniref:collagen alpha-1(I) chain-like n=1 Tax=Neovison vison TaxID=452646 RepID=UPI001CF0522F|nr:collagen alpha-1(I) chain-like [Neogale vison]
MAERAELLPSPPTFLPSHTCYRCVGGDLISELQAASPEDKGKAGAARPPGRPPRPPTGDPDSAESRSGRAAVSGPPPAGKSRAPGSGRWLNGQSSRLAQKPAPPRVPSARRGRHVPRGDGVPGGESARAQPRESPGDAAASRGPSEPPGRAGPPAFLPLPAGIPQLPAAGTPGLPALNPEPAPRPGLLWGSSGGSPRSSLGPLPRPQPAPPPTPEACESTSPAGGGGGRLTCPGRGCGRRAARGGDEPLRPLSSRAAGRRAPSSSPSLGRSARETGRKR